MDIFRTGIHNQDMSMVTNSYIFISKIRRRTGIRFAVQSYRQTSSLWRQSGPLSRVYGQTSLRGPNQAGRDSEYQAAICYRSFLSSHQVVSVLLKAALSNFKPYDVIK